MLKNDISLNDILKLKIKVNELVDLCDSYDDFEYETIEGDIVKKLSGFASQIILKKDKFNYLKIKVLNALLTDNTGYCHKIEINDYYELNTDDLTYHLT